MKRINILCDTVQAYKLSNFFKNMKVEVVGSVKGLFVFIEKTHEDIIIKALSNMGIEFESDNLSNPSYKIINEKKFKNFCKEFNL